MSKVFLYQEIIKYLEQLIEQNKMIIKYRMPSENQLAAKFNVSRITAKNAINNLVDSGKLFRHQGKGTFIVNQNFDAKYNSRLDSRASIGLMLSEIDSSFSVEAIKGATAHLDKIGIPFLIFYCNNNQDAESFLLAHTRNINVLGLLVLSVEDILYNKGLLRLALSNYPMVFLDRAIEGVEVTSVTATHFDSGKFAYKYLYDRGHRQIGFVGDNFCDKSLSQQRLLGFMSAKSEYETQSSTDKVLTTQKGQNELNDIMLFLSQNKDITAVVVSYGNVTLPLFFEALTKLNILVPNDLSVIVYGNEWSPYKGFLPFTPHYIDLRAGMIGQVAAQTIIDLINNITPSFRTNPIDFLLVEGNSVRNITT